jgi:hypothetical protein
MGNTYIEARYTTQVGNITVEYNPSTKYHKIKFDGNVIGKFTVESAAHKRAKEIKKEFDNIPNIDERLTNAKREIEEVCKKYNVNLTDEFNEGSVYVEIQWKTSKRSTSGRSKEIYVPIVIEKTIFTKNK